MIYLVLGILGLIFGSFSSMASYRLEKGQSFWGRSRCVKCKKTLGIKDLIPIYSWIKQDGKCRYCKKKISIRYPLIEVFSALAFAGVGLRGGDLVLTSILVAITMVFILIVVIDIEHLVIYSNHQIYLIILSILYAYHTSVLSNVPFDFNALVDMAMMAATLALSLKVGFILIMGKDGMGTGDVIFFFVAGMFLNFGQFAIFLICSGTLGVITAKIWEHLGWGKRFPFIPALSASLYLCLLFPDIEKIIYIITKAI